MKEDTTMTKQEQLVLAEIRKIAYGKVTVTIQAGRIVLLDKHATEKVDN